MKSNLPSSVRPRVFLAWGELFSVLSLLILMICATWPPEGIISGAMDVHIYLA